MKHWLVSRAAFGALALFLLGASAPGHAQVRLNMVMMGEDADPSSVPRTNRVFSRVQIEIMEQLNTRGHQVYDETAVSMNITQPGRVRRMDAELIEVARAVSRPPLDVLTIFQIYAAVRTSPVSDIARLEVRVMGRMLNVRTGQSIGSFEVSGQDLPPLPPGCGLNPDCVLEHVGNEAKPIGSEVAAALADKLAAFIGAPARPTAVQQPSVSAPQLNSVPAAPVCPGLPTAYVIRLAQFSAQEVSQMEGFFSAFSCFETMRPIRQSGALAEYWYESRIDQLRLTRNLQGMKDAMGINFQVQFSGNTVSLTKVLTR
jgi:hypothetical protein